MTAPEATLIDLNSKLGVHVAKRLQEEHILWLTTVASDGTPQPNPVWFYWDGKIIHVRSQPSSHKLQNITQNPKVSMNFQADEQGGDVVVLTGDATIDRNPPEPDPKFIEKYSRGNSQDRTHTRKLSRGLQCLNPNHAQKTTGLLGSINLCLTNGRTS